MFTNLKILSLILPLSVVLANPAPDDEYSQKLEAIYTEFRGLENPRDIATLVKIDQELRELIPAIVDIEMKTGWHYYRKEYEDLGIQMNHWGGNLEYSGKPLEQAHDLDPNSAYRNRTLFSEVEIDYTRSGLPGIEAGHRYATEFPDGPFIDEVYRVLATFYDDLYKSARGELTDDPQSTHLLYRECYEPYFSTLPFEAQMIHAQALSVFFYKLALKNLDAESAMAQSLKKQLESVRDGTTQGFYWCSAC